MPETVKATATTAQEGNLLEVRDLTVSFPTADGRTEVVKSLDLDVPRGGAVGIVGESGSGKSMTSLAIMDLLPKGGRRSGSLRLDGIELTDLSPAAMRRVNLTDPETEVELDKSNILLIGPTGCGKTLLARTMARTMTTTRMMTRILTMECLLP